MPTGAWPVNPATEVGLFRIDIGDDVPTVTPADGATEANFEFFADETITAYIARDADDLNEAMAKALDKMSRNLILAAQDIQVDDIKIKTVERAKLFADMAAGFRDGSLVSSADSAFDVVPLYSTASAGYRVPQGTPTPWDSVM